MQASVTAQAETIARQNAIIQELTGELLKLAKLVAELERSNFDQELARGQLQVANRELDLRQTRQKEMLDLAKQGIMGALQVAQARAAALPSAAASAGSAGGAPAAPALGPADAAASLGELIRPVVASLTPDTCKVVLGDLVPVLVRDRDTATIFVGSLQPATLAQVRSEAGDEALRRLLTALQ